MEGSEPWRIRYAFPWQLVFNAFKWNNQTFLKAIDEKFITSTFRSETSTFRCQSVWVQQCHSKTCDSGHSPVTCRHSHTLMYWWCYTTVWTSSVTYWSSTSGAVRCSHSLLHTWECLFNRAGRPGRWTDTKVYLTTHYLVLGCFSFVQDRNDICDWLTGGRSPFARPLPSTDNHTSSAQKQRENTIKFIHWNSKTFVCHKQFLHQKALYQWTLDLISHDTATQGFLMCANSHN